MSKDIEPVVIGKGKCKVLMIPPRIKAGKFLPLIDGKYDEMPQRKPKPKVEPLYPEAPYADGKVFDKKNRCIGYYAVLEPCPTRKQQAYVGYDTTHKVATRICNSEGEVLVLMKGARAHVRRRRPAASP